MSRNTAAIFAAIEAFDPDKFVAHLTEDVVSPSPRSTSSTCARTASISPFRTPTS